MLTERLTSNENIQERNIENELKTSYLTYAMSVNTNRAIPDVRDGLKPSTRRIIYAMGQINLTAQRPYDKCAAVVGEVMKNFHPHGDGPIYGTLVGMAQDFNTRYPLIDGQGNFGSIDDDPPGAMRYTECRLARIASEMLTDIQKEVVDFQPNYKDSLEEPTVLPGLLPNLLLNGTTGIGVGYLTRIPPHNLGEVVDALLCKLENRDAGAETLMEYIAGPDFPTAGSIVGRSGIKAMYTTGRGSVTIRAKAIIERVTTGSRKVPKEQIVITEIPYQVKKNQLLERMYHLVVNKTITGISDIRDESDTDIRIVIALKRGEIAQVILNQLYKHTQMQTNFSASLLCLVDGLPKVLTLDEILRHYLQHRRDVIRRRTGFDLARAERRAHILEGYLTALQNLEDIIELVQNAASPDAALAQLRETYDLSEAQAREILTMTLRQLTGLERQRIRDEHTDKLEEIAELRAILGSEVLITDIIRTELGALKDTYGDERRTEITDAVKAFEIEDLIADEEMVVTLSHAGYLKRLPVDTYRKQRRGGVGVKGGATKDGDFLEHLFIASAHQYILFFTDKGKCYWLKVFEIPEGSRTAAGRAIVNLLRLAPDENITAFVPVREFNEDRFVFMATAKGIVKKTNLAQFQNPLASGIIAVNLDEGDRLIGAQLTDGAADVILVTQNGIAIRFSEMDIRAIGRKTRGVRGINLKSDDAVVTMVTTPVVPGIAPPKGGHITEREETSKPAANPLTLAGDRETIAPCLQGHITERDEKKRLPLTAPAAHSESYCSSQHENDLLIVTENGYGKRTAVSAYRAQKRGGKGVIAIKKSKRNGAIVAAKHVAESDELVLISSNAYVTRMRVSDIRRIGRNTEGVRMMTLQTDETLVDLGKIELEDNRDIFPESEE